MALSKKEIDDAYEQKFKEAKLYRMMVRAPKDPKIRKEIRDFVDGVNQREGYVV